MVPVEGLEPLSYPALFRVCVPPEKLELLSYPVLLCVCAPTRDRTADLLITNQLLCQLSYRGVNTGLFPRQRERPLLS